jgi:bacillopeptidase F (M6 metalloprotease family)
VATVVSGDPPSWETSTTTPNSAPNDAFVVDQDGISDKVLDSRNITINSAAAVLSFKNNFNTEHDPPPTEVFWDGYVLEVSTDGGGTYTDIIGAGGTFVSGPYTGEIDGTANNPLAGRMAWSGNSGGYIDTVINLPASFNGQTIKLRFRMGTDEAVAAPGARVDDLSINGGSCP